VNWLCDLGHRLAHHTYDDLTTSFQSGGRLQLSEVGITHDLARLIWVQAAATGRADTVLVREYDGAAERRTGADLELWFTDGSVGVGWLVQAKRLYPAKGHTPPRFQQMPHKVRGEFQAARLIRSAAQLGLRLNDVAPIYWLYAFAPTSDLCDGTPGCRCSALSPCDGIRVVSADRVLWAMQRMSRQTEPLSYHRWEGVSSPLPGLLCRASTAHSPSAMLAVLASIAASLPGAKSRGRPVELPNRVRLLLDTAAGLDDQLQPADVGATVVVDVRGG
jgi:hypothetical protein